MTQKDGLLALLDGALAEMDGALTQLDGELTLLDGAFALLDGALTLWDDALTLSDGALSQWHCPCQFCLLHLLNTAQVPCTVFCAVYRTECRHGSLAYWHCVG